MIHKYQLNEAVRVNLPKLGLYDSSGRIYVRHPFDEPNSTPIYDVIVFKTNGVYRCTEDMLQVDPDHIPDVQLREPSLDEMKQTIVDLGKTITELQLENARLRQLQAEFRDSHANTK